SCRTLSAGSGACSSRVRWPRRSTSARRRVRPSRRPTASIGVARRCRAGTSNARSATPQARAPRSGGTAPPRAPPAAVSPRGGGGRGAWRAGGAGRVWGGGGGAEERRALPALVQSLVARDVAVARIDLPLGAALPGRPTTGRLAALVDAGAAPVEATLLGVAP